MPLYAYLTPKVDFKRKFNHHHAIVSLRMTIDSADDSKISNRTITTNRISNRTYDLKSNRITKLRRSLMHSLNCFEGDWLSGLSEVFFIVYLAIGMKHKHFPLRKTVEQICIWYVHMFPFSSVWPRKGKEVELVYCLSSVTRPLSAQMWITQSYLQIHHICLSFV